MINKKSRYIIIGVLFLTFALTILSYTLTTFAIYKGGAEGTIKDLKVSNFNIKVNDNVNAKQEIDLTKTILPNDYSNTEVIPGTKGKIDLVFDFTEVETDANYTVSVGNLQEFPKNFKLYSDTAMTTPYQTESYNHKLSDPAKVTKTIYWKWDFKTDDASNTDDNKYQAKALTMPLVISVEQDLN